MKGVIAVNNSPNKWQEILPIFLLEFSLKVIVIEAAILPIWDVTVVFFYKSKTLLILENNTKGWTKIGISRAIYKIDKLTKLLNEL